MIAVLSAQVCTLYTHPHWNQGLTAGPDNMLAVFWSLAACQIPSWHQDLGYFWGLPAVLQGDHMAPIGQGITEWFITLHISVPSLGILIAIKHSCSNCNGRVQYCGGMPSCITICIFNAEQLNVHAIWCCDVINCALMTSQSYSPAQY